MTNKGKGEKGIFFTCRAFLYHTVLDCTFSFRIAKINIIIRGCNFGSAPPIIREGVHPHLSLSVTSGWSFFVLPFFGVYLLKRLDMNLIKHIYAC